MFAWTQSFAVGGRALVRRTLLAAVGLEPYERGIVRPHERTHAGPKADRLRLMRAVKANISPVFAVYPDRDGVAWAAAGADGPPQAEFTDREGTVHRLWRVAHPAACAEVTRALADRWIMIADGHHRYETALAYRRDNRRADRVMMGLTSLDDPGLVVLPTHRVLTAWPNGAADAFRTEPVASLEALLDALRRAPADGPAVGLVRPQGAVLVTAPPVGGSSPAARLDTTWLERELLLPAFGADQATLTADGTLGYTKDPEEAWRRVRADGGAALVLRAPTTAQVAAVAEAGETMPQKSTYFHPKLLTGVAFNPLPGD
jgi:uncharacterized protein (DUF1015 family)